MSSCFHSFNPLTPVPPVTASDEPWPFFLFWRYRFWPKLASSILNFCRRKRSFQWCPDQSDQPNGALDMHKNAQKVEWKTWSKISCHYTWMLLAKNCPSRWRFLGSFLTESKPSRRSIPAAKTRKASYCVANAFSTGSEVIWPRCSLKITEMSKKRTFCKKFQESMG